MMLTKVLLLKQLYIMRLIGEKYCESIDLSLKKDIIFKSTNLSDVIKNCNLCSLSKYAKDKNVGIKGSGNIAFITLKPVLAFSASETMIKNISKNIFNEDNYSLFSIIKCNSNTNIDDNCIHICKEYLKSQIDATNLRLIILFGEDVAKYILQIEDKIENLNNRIIKSKNLLNKEKNFIVTYSINDLIKKPALKPLAFDGFKIAKEFLATRS